MIRFPFMYLCFTSSNSSSTSRSSGFPDLESSPFVVGVDSSLLTFWARKRKAETRLEMIELVSVLSIVDGAPDSDKVLARVFRVSGLRIVRLFFCLAICLCGRTNYLVENMIFLIIFKIKKKNI